MAKLKTIRGRRVLPDHKIKIALSVSEERNSYGKCEWFVQTTQSSDPWIEGFGRDLSNPALSHVGGARTCKSAVGAKEHVKQLVKDIKTKLIASGEMNPKTGVINWHGSKRVVGLITRIDTMYRGTKDGSPHWNNNWSTG
jgi:hypothetical protein